MNEPELVAECLEALQAALPAEAELHLEPGEVAVGAAPEDRRLNIRGPWGRIELPVEAKARVNKPTVALIDRRLRHRGHTHPDEQGDQPTWMLFTEHVTAPQAREFRAQKIAFADTRGNAHLWGPGLFVWVIGNKPAARRPKTARLTRPAAARVIFALVQDPRRVQEPYRELAEQADVAPDTVNRVFNDLQHKGFLRVWGVRERELTRLPELVELWTLAYEEGLRAKLQPKRCQWLGGGELERLMDRLPTAPNEIPILLGGEVAAAIMTDTLRPTTATLHVPPGAQRDAMKYLDLIPRAEGPVTLLHTFGETNAWEPRHREPAHLADPLLVHAELMRNGDDRARLAADEIYDQYIVRRFLNDQ